MSTPEIKQQPVTRTAHGDQRNDPYAWLEQREDAAVIALLEAENRHTQTCLADTEALQAQLFQEIIGRVELTDQSLPYRWGDYEYYTRTDERLEYPIYCRRPIQADGSPAAEEILLDANQLASGQSYLDLGCLEVSADHRLLAYALDTQGNELYDIHFKELATGRLLDDRIDRCCGNLVWAADHATVFYTRPDASQRPWQVWRYHLGQPANHQLVFEEPDPQFWVAVSLTQSEAFVVIESASKQTTESYVLPADRPYETFRSLYPRQAGVEYYPEHHADYFYIRTNDRGPEFRLVRTPVDAPADWQEVIPHRDAVTLEDLDIFADFLVLSERDCRGHKGTPQLRVISWDGRLDYYLPCLEEAYILNTVDNAEYHSQTLRIHYESLTTPASIFDVDMPTGQRFLRKQAHIKGGFVPSDYRSERLYATAPDGERIPITLVARREVLANATPAPCYLHGYGAYSEVLDPWFSAARLSLLERGFIFALAHVRGGGDLGEDWYKQGRLAHKQNSFDDFIACAEHLIERGYTAADRLVAAGGSAGGLLIGAVLNQRPDLFHAAVADVPFVDVLNTMLDPELPLTVAEYEEWGNPEYPEDYWRIRAYSPYDNIKAQNYPHLLVTAGLHDPRVQYWEPAKWVARLRELKTDDNMLLLKTHMEAGHGGASGRFEGVREIALEYAFILKVLGYSTQ